MHGFTAVASVQGSVPCKNIVMFTKGSNEVEFYITCIEPHMLTMEWRSTVNGQTTKLPGFKYDRIAGTIAFN
jgi:hypothetical protein